MKLIAIDPGLDGTGVAIFDLAAFLRAFAPGFDEAMSCLVHTALIETSAGQLHRLAKIAALCEDAVQFWRPHLIYVEQPAIDGQYRGRGRFNRSAVNQMYEARGAVLAGLEAGTSVCLPSAPIHHLRAVKMRKDARHELMAHAGAGKLPYGPRGGIIEDVWDAAWVGIQALCTRAVADLRAAAAAAPENA